MAWRGLDGVGGGELNGVLSRGNAVERRVRGMPGPLLTGPILVVLLLAGLLVVSTGRASAQSNNAELGSLSVDFVSVPGFSADRTSYEYGTAKSEVTIIAAPDDPLATVEYSGTDQDSAVGHQHSLSNGRNRVTITVTARNGTNTKTYTLDVNRSVFWRGGWHAAKDIDSLVHAGNTEPRGIWSNGTTMWVVDWLDEKLYAYTLSTGVRDEDQGVGLALRQRQSRRHLVKRDHDVGD